MRESSLHRLLVLSQAHSLSVLPAVRDQPNNIPIESIGFDHFEEKQEVTSFVSLSKIGVIIARYLKIGILLSPWSFREKSCLEIKKNDHRLHDEIESAHGIPIFILLHSLAMVY